MIISHKEWVKEAEAKLKPYMGNQSREYAENLYQTYVIDAPDGDWTPEDAVDEDMGYWDIG